MSELESASGDHRSPVPAPGAPPIYVDRLFTGSARLSSPPNHPAATRTGSDSRSFTAERDHQVSLAKQKASARLRHIGRVTTLRSCSHGRRHSPVRSLAELRPVTNKVLKKRPNHFEALIARSERAPEWRFRAALRLLKRALLLDPLSAPVQCDLGIVLCRVATAR